MPKLIIELPEEAYQNAMALSPDERERMVVNTFRTAKNERPDFDRETNEADLEAIGRGIEDAKAGRVSRAEDVLARLQWSGDAGLSLSS